MKYYRQFGHTRDIKKSGRQLLKKEDIVNNMLTVEGNPHSTLKITALTFNLAHYIKKREKGQIITPTKLD